MESMAASVETHVDKPCDVCGVTGVVEAIATCSRCKLNCEHIYCMREFHTDLPSHWCCGTCESTDLVSSDTSAKKEQLKAVRFDLSTAATVPGIPPGFGPSSGGRYNDIPPGFSERFKNMEAKCDDIPPGFTSLYRIKK